MQTTKGAITAMARKLYDVACSYEEDNQHESAAACFEQCAVAHEAVHNGSEEIRMATVYNDKTAAADDTDDTGDHDNDSDDDDNDDDDEDDEDKEDPLIIADARQRANCCRRAASASAAMQALNKTTVLESESLNMATAQFNLASVYTEQAKVGEAIKLFKKALAVQEKLLGQHPQTARTQIAIVKAELQRMHTQQDLRAGDKDKVYKEVLQLYSGALAIQEKVLGPCGEVASMLWDIAKIHEARATLIDSKPKLIMEEQFYKAAMGPYDDSLALFKKSLTIYEKEFGPESKQVSNAFHRIGKVHHKQAAIAKKYWAKLVIYAIDVFVMNGSEMPDECSWQARVLSGELKHHEQAVEFLERYAATQREGVCNKGDEACSEYDEDACAICLALRSRTQVEQIQAADERAPLIDKVGALLDDTDPSVRAAAARGQKSTGLFVKSSVTERAPYMDKLAVLLDDWDRDVCMAALCVFSHCTASERVPYLEEIAALIDDEDRSVRNAVGRFFSECSTDERAPFEDVLAEADLDEEDFF